MKKRMIGTLVAAAFLVMSGCGPFYDINDAVAEGDVTAVGVILDRNPGPVNSRDDFGDTPLHRAVIKGNIALIRLLLQKGANVNARRRHTGSRGDGETALHLAAQYGRYRIAVLLIKAKARVALKDSGGWLPIHWAAAGGHLRVVELLVMNLSPWLTRTNMGQTPSDLARERGHTRVVNFLRFVIIDP